MAGMRKGFLRRLDSTPAVKARNALICIIPAALSIIALGVFPAALNVTLSFTNYNGDFAKMSFIGLTNYTNFFRLFGKDIGFAMLFTLEYMGLTIIPVQIFAILTALLVNAKIRGSNFFRAVFFMPSILGISVICMTWSIILDYEDGAVTALIKFLDLNYKAGLLGSEKTAMIWVGVIAVWSSFGFSMAIYLAALQGVSKDYYEAGKLDGINAWTGFWRITLPLIWPSITICLWIALSGTIGMSDYIILLTGGGRNTKTIGFYIYDITMRGGKVTRGQVAAVSIYFFIFTSTIMILFNKFVRKREVEM